jgi:hypothetical protein
MTISRRRFVKSGFILGIIAGLPITWAAKSFAQKKRQRVRATDPLTYYSRATFAAYANTDFVIHAGAAGLVFMRLTQIQDLQPETLQPPDECFGLLFTAPTGTAIPQKTYEVEHGALGKFSLFLVPINRPTVAGPAYYQAVFNRRGVNDDLRIDSRPALVRTTGGVIKRL